MAEFKTVMREFQRLCSGRKCVNCPVGNEVFCERESLCCTWVKNHPEEAERIIMKWSAEHPIMTNAKKFEQVFGFSFYYRFGGSDVDTAWLAEEYKGGQDNGSD